MGVNDFQLHRLACKSPPNDSNPSTFRQPFRPIQGTTAVPTKARVPDNNFKTVVTTIINISTVVPMGTEIAKVLADNLAEVQFSIEPWGI